MLPGNDVSTLRQRLLERFVNFYPPFLGAGIRSHNVDATTIQVTMKLTAFNRNLVGVHFGGSLYAMCDPWFMLILMRALGPDYIVWDKAANIQFLRPARGKVAAVFHIAQGRIAEIRAEADRGSKIEPTFLAEVLDDEQQIVARVEKLLYVRRKNLAKE
jgi:acyl-coenzyme A thioesterase PaaI-like protein